MERREEILVKVLTARDIVLGMGFLHMKGKIVKLKPGVSIEDYAAKVTHQHVSAVSIRLLNDRTLNSYVHGARIFQGPRWADYERVRKERDGNHILGTKYTTNRMKANRYDE